MVRSAAVPAPAPRTETTEPIHAGTESRAWEITTGSNATNTAPNTAPCRLPRPPTTTMSRNWIENSTPKMSGARKPILCAKSAPARPIKPAEYENAIVLYTARLTPMDCAAISLSRMATQARPVGARRRLRVSQSPPIRNPRQRK